MGITAEKLQRGQDKLERSREAWGFVSAGESFVIGNSLLEPVSYEGLPAMVKISLDGKEQHGYSLLACWEGKGAVKVYRYSAEALLMERAVGNGSLKRMVLSGEEDEANRIICGIVGVLHSRDCTSVPGLIPLPVVFRSLETAAGRYGGWFVIAQRTAAGLLAEPRDVVALHGDIHYDNILDSGVAGRGWLAIDPKGMLGERGFDYANLFTNPDPAVAGKPERLARQSLRIAVAAGLEASRLLRWIVAWCGLSAAWMLEDREEEKLALPLKVCEMALSELAHYGINEGRG